MTGITVSRWTFLAGWHRVFSCLYFSQFSLSTCWWIVSAPTWPFFFFFFNFFSPWPLISKQLCTNWAVDHSVFVLPRKPSHTCPLRVLPLLRWPRLPGHNYSSWALDGVRPFLIEDLAVSCEKTIMTDTFPGQDCGSELVQSALLGVCGFF